jgi:hypothetical protein
MVQEKNEKIMEEIKKQQQFPFCPPLHFFDLTY